MEQTKCKCEHCTTHNLYKWSVVMNCKCSCHEDGFSSHSGMCCELPNVLKANNPHRELESPEFYKSILDRIQEEDEIQMKQFKSGSTRDSNIKVNKDSTQQEKLS